MPRVGKIAQLPPELRERLHKALISRGCGDIVAVTDELNAWIAKEGLATTVGKSAVGKEAQRIRRLQENIRVTTEAARVIAETSRDDGDVRGEALLATIQTDTWNTLLELREADSMDDPLERLKALTKAATGIAETSRARVNQAKWRGEVEAKVKAAAEAAGKLLRKSGASATTIAEIRNGILGITARARPAP